MKSIYIFIQFLFLLCVVALSADELPPSPARGAELIDHIMQDAIGRGLIAGGVVFVGNGRGPLHEKAFGKIAPGNAADQVTTDTVFDIASLTKVVATAPSIMKLAEAGELSLVDPVVRWFPEFTGKGKDDLLVVHLLTHTSGLDDIHVSSVNPIQSVIDGAATQRLKGEVGSRFRYADLNFILLGELVRRVSGISLDRYAEHYFYSPLGMTDTAFNPPERIAARCAATLDAGNMPVSGTVQDLNSRLLGGVAGHAGVFSSARDLARYCMMILNGGELAGHRVLSQRAVSQMTAPYFSRGGKVVRGLGWDIASPFSSPRGSGFSEISFGHTGYSGSSIWIDPEKDVYVILLTSRLDYRSVSEFNRLRGDLSTAVTGQFVAPGRFASSDMLRLD